MFDRTALADIPPDLWSLFLPQLDQLGATPLRTGVGIGGRIDSPLAHGWFWGLAIADDCIVHALRVEVKRDFVLTEEPKQDYLSLGMMTNADVASMNSLSSAFLPASNEAVYLLPMGAGSHDFALRAGSVHGGTSVSMLPSYVERALQTYEPEERVLLADACAGPLELTDDVSLRATLRSITPADATRRGAAQLYRARAQEALALAAMHALGPAEQGRRVDSFSARVDAILRRTLSSAPSLDQLAAQLYVSKALLCRKFKEETGLSVGQRLTQIRVEEAQVMLCASGRAIGEIAALVGFRHQSSFDAAFKRACGMSPARWREEHRTI